MTKKYRQRWKTRQATIADHGKTVRRLSGSIPASVDPAAKTAAIKAAVQHKRSAEPLL